MRRRDRAAHLLLLFAFAVIPAVVIAIGGFGFDQDIFVRAPATRQNVEVRRVSMNLYIELRPHIYAGRFGGVCIDRVPNLSVGIRVAGCLRWRGVGDHIPVFTKALAFAFSGGRLTEFQRHEPIAIFLRRSFSNILYLIGDPQCVTLFFSSKSSHL